jgi:putative toxin-antitoxin system antitoxin component (TIGR02293 family)
MNKVEEPLIHYGTLGHYAADLSDPIRLVMASKKGVTTRSFDDLVKVSLQARDTFAQRLHISLKTIERYRKEGRTFDPMMGELILKWLQLYAKGLEVFGSIRAFNRWLEKPAYGLNSMLPEDLLSNSTGVSLIFDELVRIERGDLA